MHFDNAGNPLTPGTKVLYLGKQFQSRKLRVGVVFSHTPKMIRMENGDLQFPELCAVVKEP